MGHPEVPAGCDLIQVAAGVLKIVILHRWGAIIHLIQFLCLKTLVLTGTCIPIFLFNFSVCEFAAWVNLLFSCVDFQVWSKCSCLRECLQHFNQCDTGLTGNKAKVFFTLYIHANSLWHRRPISLVSGKQMGEESTKGLFWLSLAHFPRWVQQSSCFYMVTFTFYSV